MKLALPLLLLVVVVLFVLIRRARRPQPQHTEVDRRQIARTASHAETATAPQALLEAVVETLVEHRPTGRPPRRYVVRSRDERSAELALRLVEDRHAPALLTVLVETDPTPTGTHARLEVLDITPVEGVADRLREVARTRDLVLGTVARLDPAARFRDELLPLVDDDAPDPAP